MQANTEDVIDCFFNDLGPATIGEAGNHSLTGEEQYQLIPINGTQLPILREQTPHNPAVGREAFNDIAPTLADEVSACCSSSRVARGRRGSSGGGGRRGLCGGLGLIRIMLGRALLGKRSMLFGLTLRCLRRRAVSPTLRRLSDFPAAGRSRGFRVSFGNGLRLILRSALLPTLFGLLSSQGLTRLASTKGTRTRRLFCRRPSPNEANSARKRTRPTTRLSLRGSNVSGIRVCAWGGYQDPADQEFELKPGRGCTRHRTQSLIGQISGARERLGTPVLCLDAHAFKLIVWGANQNITGAVTRNGDDQQVA